MNRKKTLKECISSSRSKAQRKIRKLKDLMTVACTHGLLKCEVAELSFDYVAVSGWAVSRGVIDRIEVSLDGRILGRASHGLPRPDVAFRPLISTTDKSGFCFYSYREPVDEKPEKHALSIKAWDKDNKPIEMTMTMESASGIPSLTYALSHFDVSRFEVDGAILIIDHELGGGANLYRQGLVKEKREAGACVLLLTYKLYGGYYTLQLCENGREVSCRFKDLDEFLPLAKKMSFKEVILNDLVSFRDPAGVLSMIKNLRDSQAGTLTTTLHDYFALCPGYTLLNDRKEFCGIPDIEECAPCIKNNTSPLMPQNCEDMREWRKRWGEVLENSDRIVCFSDSSRDILGKVYPSLSKGSIEVTPHKVNYLHPISCGSHRGFFRIGILGFIGIEKGIIIIKEMLQIIKDRNLPVKIIIIGGTSENLRHRNLISTGAYRREEIMDLTKKHKIDMFFLPSLVPETFSFTAEEIITMHMPLAVFDLGAPAERVKKYEKGLIIQKIDAGAALDEIVSWIKNRKTP